MKLAANSPPHWQSASLAGVRHAFFGREGGVSTGVYASLNAGPGSNDDPDAVKENRRRIAAAFDLPPTHLTGVHQVHSPTCVMVSAPWSGERPHADALVTTTPRLAISVLTADCTPVLLADRNAGVIAAAHAGWKGAIGGVLESTVAMMRQRGATDVAAAIGPTIQQTSYEVGPEFEARFVAADAGNARFFRPGTGDRRHFDLPAFCASRLQALGVTKVEILPLDTCADAVNFHSNRRALHEKAADYGRNCAVIALG
ncbi:MAG: peptidoglycan editing factor PgeF [Terricaulis sp.]